MFDEREFRIQMIRADISMKELAAELGMDGSTLYRKIKNGGSFTRAEINRLIEILKMSDPKSVFFAEELAETQD